MKHHYIVCNMTLLVRVFYYIMYLWFEKKNQESSAWEKCGCDIMKMCSCFLLMVYTSCLNRSFSVANLDSPNHKCSSRPFKDKWTGPMSPGSPFSLTLPETVGVHHLLHKPLLLLAPLSTQDCGLLCSYSPQLGLLKCPELPAEHSPSVWLVGHLCPHWRAWPEPSAMVRTSITVAHTAQSWPLPSPLGFAVTTMTLLSMFFPFVGQNGADRTEKDLRNRFPGLRIPRHLVPNCPFSATKPPGMLLCPLRSQLLWVGKWYVSNMGKKTKFETCW